MTIIQRGGGLSFMAQHCAKNFSERPPGREKVRPISGIRCPWLNRNDGKRNFKTAIISPATMTRHGFPTARPSDMWDAKLCQRPRLRASGRRSLRQTESRCAAVIAERQHFFFSPPTKLAITMLGRGEERPIYEGRLRSELEGLLKTLCGYAHAGDWRRGRDEHRARVGERANPRNWSAPCTGSEAESHSHAISGGVAGGSRWIGGE